MTGVTNSNPPTPRYCCEQNCTTTLSVIAAVVATLFAVFGGVCYFTPQELLATNYALGIFCGGIAIDLAILTLNGCKKAAAPPAKAEKATPVATPPKASPASQTKTDKAPVQAPTLTAEEEKQRQVIAACSYNVNLVLKNSGQPDCVNGILPNIFLGNQFIPYYLSLTENPIKTIYPEPRAAWETLKSSLPNNLVIMYVGTKTYTADHGRLHLAQGVSLEYIAPGAGDNGNDWESIEPALSSAYDIIDKAQREGKKLFIHCVMGINRSVTVLAYYIMRKYKVTYNQALGFIQSKRPRVLPSLELRRALATHIEEGIPRDKNLQNKTFQQLEDSGHPLFDKRIRNYKNIGQPMDLPND